MNPNCAVCGKWLEHGDPVIPIYAHIGIVGRMHGSDHRDRWACAEHLIRLGLAFVMVGALPIGIFADAAMR